MAKTLIGKEGYLFLTNDSNSEIAKHCSKDYTCNTDIINMYSTLENFLLVVFPDKSYVLPQYLPDGFNPIYRPVFDQYQRVLGEHVVDGYTVIKDTPETYLKLDTHMNLKGSIMMFNATIARLNQLFGFTFDFISPLCERVECTTFHGDLTNPENLGTQLLYSMHEIYYKIEGHCFLNGTIITGNTFRLLTKQLVDCTDIFINQTASWQIRAEHIIYQNNPDKRGKVLIFHDSFTEPLLLYLLSMFHEVYIVKGMFSIDLVKLINPSHILEMRVERFLL